MVLAFFAYKIVEAGYLLKNVTVLTLQCQIYILYKLFPLPFLMSFYDILEKVLYMDSMEEVKKRTDSDDDDEDDEDDDEDSDND